MGRFSGPQAKGAQRTAKEQRRIEAEARDEACEPERRRAFRLGRVKVARTKREKKPSHSVRGT